MSSKFLDKTGLDTLWAKIKSTFQTLGNLVTAWGSTPSDTKYPSEKLVKTSLDAKAPNAVTTEAAIATNDKLLFSDASDSSKTKRMSTGFDTGLTTTMLRRDGTFARVLYADEAWGGAFRTSLSPFDNYAFKNANCFFGAKPSAIRVEYSTDGGTTWLDYGMTDAYKQHMLSQYGTGAAYCGKNTHIQPGYTGSIVGTKDLSDENIADQRLRITICECSLANEGTTASTDRWLYCNLRRIGIYMSTQSAGGGAHCLFEKRTRGNFKNGIDTWTTVGDYKIQGNSGWNSIPCGNATSESSIRFGANADSTYAEIRFTIWSDKLSATPAASQTGNLCIFRIVAYSELLWLNNSTNPNMGNYGVPYTVSQTTGSASFSKGITSDVAIPISSGGTGKTSVTAGNYLVGNGTSALTEKTPKQVGNNVLPALDAGGDNVFDTDYIIASNHTSGATDATTFVRRTAGKLWNYIKGQISSVLGLTATDYGGNAATATTATTAAGYTSGGAIDTALQGKATPDDIASAIQALDVASQGGDGKYIKAISEADGKISATAETMDTTPTANSTKAVTSGGVKNALDGKQDALGISSSGDAGKYLNEQGNWATPAGTEQVNADWDATSGKAEILHKPTVSRYFNKYSRNTSVYGWKIGSTVTGNANGVSSIITGVFTLALGINVRNAPQESTDVKTDASMVGFFSCYARYENGSNTVKARIYTPVSSISNSTFNLKYIDEGNGKFTWVLGFGTGSTPESKAYVYCSVNVMSSVNANFENFGDAITSSPTYATYFTVFKSPYIPQNTSGIGNEKRPVYVNDNGLIVPCTYAISTSTTGTDTNTIYLV